MEKHFVLDSIDLSKGVMVIPEIGINHEGSLDVAKQMVDAAFRAGARIVKFQTHIVSDEMSSLARKTIPGNADVSIYDIMDRCSLTEEEEYNLKQYVEEKGMIYLSTPFSRAAADRLQRMGVVGFKIGSGEMNNYPLLEHIASFGKPIILSTGMNSLDAIRKATEILRAKGVDYCLLHTTNLYPTSPEQVRLGAMLEMMDEFDDVFVGLSDHTVNNFSAYAALALGARVVERHFTDHKKRTGPDIVCSMAEEDLRQLLQAAREIPQMMGGHKVPLPEEQVTMDFAFSTLVTISNVKKGEAFSMSNLWAKRPGIGKIPAGRLSEILGMHAACDIPNDTNLCESMIEELK